MSKRLSDTCKWHKVWFRKLQPIHKCFFEFIRDNCDHAGFWDVDIEAAQFYINGKLDRDELLKVFSDQIKEINDKKWFLPDFISFQYKTIIEDLNPDNKVHKSVIDILSKNNMKERSQVPVEGLSSPLKGAKDKDKVLDKVKASHLFVNSPFYDINVFIKKFYENEKYLKFDADYYYESIANWSSENSRKKANWISTAYNWARKDEQEGKPHYGNHSCIQLPDR